MSERFYLTFKHEIEAHKDFFEWQQKRRATYQSTLEHFEHCLQTYGGFLDEISTENRSTIMYALIDHIDVLYDKQETSEDEGLDKRGRDKRISDVNVIKRAMDIIDNCNFTHLEIPSAQAGFARLFKAEVLYGLSQTIDDIENQQYKYINRYRYYKTNVDVERNNERLSTSQGLEKILLAECKSNNLTRVSTKIDVLVKQLTNLDI